jgi:hypothetical protein
MGFCLFISTNNYHIYPTALLYANVRIHVMSNFRLNILYSIVTIMKIPYVPPLYSQLLDSGKVTHFLDSLFCTKVNTVGPFTADSKQYRLYLHVEDTLHLSSSVAAMTDGGGGLNSRTASTTLFATFRAFLAKFVAKPLTDGYLPVLPRVRKKNLLFLCCKYFLVCGFKLTFSSINISTFLL